MDGGKRKKRGEKSGKKSGRGGKESRKK